LSPFRYDIRLASSFHMQPGMVFRFLCCALIAGPVAFRSAADSAPASWRVAPREAWIQDAPAGALPARTGAGLLLHDRQIRLTAVGDDRYEHTLQRVSGARSPEQAPEIHVAVDPRFQELVIHTLRLRHAQGGERTFTAAQIREQVRTQPGEAEPRRREFNPRMLISIEVPDTQPQDLLECEYTVHTRAVQTPGLFAGHYAAQWPSGGDEPVRWARLHVIWPAERSLQYRIGGGSAGNAPKIQAHAGELDLQWQNLLPPEPEEDTPRWFDRESTVQLSDFADWTQVATLLAPEYAPSEHAQATAPPPPPTALAAPGQILNALRLVQSKVHPVQVSGESVHVPADPAQVLQRGYGDSRDIARLLVWLLRGVGIDAQVALANSRGVLLDTRLPSPFILDAVVVVARAGTVEYWLDPSAPGPAQSLSTTDPAQLRRALLIAAADGRVVALPLPAPDSRRRLVTQQFDLRHDGQPAALILTTRYEGSWVPAVRAALLVQPPAQLQLTQSESVAQDYAGAGADGQVQLQDLPAQRAVQLTARFRIPHPFADPQEPQFNFFAESLTEVVQPRDEATRHYPLGLSWPLQLDQDIEATLPLDFAATPGTLVIENPAFRYQRVVSFAHDRLSIHHSYVALSDHVDPADYPKFVAANAVVYAALGLHVRRQEGSWRDGVAWLGNHWLLLVAIAVIVAVTLAGWRRMRRG
jgi:transglutaminase-like putative cysteine protease